MKMIIKLIMLCLVTAMGAVQAASPNVFEYTVEKSMQQVYAPLYKALEDEGFYVVFEANIGRNLSRFADKWGENYNRNKLDAIRSMVFCNGWFANEVIAVIKQSMALKNNIKQ
jgi:hypothetical protein